MSATYTFPSFTAAALECGHGDDFRALFTIRESITGGSICIESVDLVMVADCGHESCIGAVGGEIMMRRKALPDGTTDYEQICRDWVRAWDRNFSGRCEDSVQGLYLMIRQTVSEGKFTPSTSEQN